MKHGRYNNNSQPKSASEVLRGAFSAYHINDKIQQYEAFPRWRKIVGEKIADVAVPEKIIRGNVLVLRVLDSAWAQELTMQKQFLLDKLQEEQFGALIEDLHFVSGDPSAVRKRL